VADEFDRAVLLAAYRLAQVPASARRDRVLARLREPDDAPVFLPEPAGRPVAMPGIPLRVVLLAAAAAVLAVLGLELLTGGLAVRFDRTPVDQAVDVPETASEPSEAVEREEHVASPPKTDAPLAASAVVIPPPPAVAAPASAPPPVRVPSAARAKGSSADAPAAVAVQEPTRVLSEREREAAMIADALAALDRKAWGEAVVALTKHAKEFPKGELRLERDALRIVVRCEREHGEAARIQARDFIVSTALSPHWQRIIDACRAKAPPVVDPFHEPAAEP